MPILPALDHQGGGSGATARCLLCGRVYGCPVGRNSGCYARQPLECNQRIRIGLVVDERTTSSDRPDGHVELNLMRELDLLHGLRPDPSCRNSPLADRIGHLGRFIVENRGIASAQQYGGSDIGSLLDGIVLHGCWIWRRHHQQLCG